MKNNSKNFHSKQRISKWRNVFLPPPSYFKDERNSEAPSGRSQPAGSLESSILLLSTDQSVMEWKKSSCERLSSDGQQNRELLLQAIDLEDDLISDDAKNESIKDTAVKLKIVEENKKLSTNQARKELKDAEITKDTPFIHQALGDDLRSLDMSLCDMSVQEANMNDKFEKLIIKDQLAVGLVSDERKPENIKDTVTEVKKIVEENEKSSINPRPNEDNQKTKGPLVIPLALDDDCQSSGLSFCVNISREEHTDDDIDNVHNKSVSGKDYFVSVNIYGVPQNPAPLRNENMKVWNMPKALQQLGIDYDSSESFCDNQSVKDAYDTFENLIKKDDLTENEQMLTSTPRRNYYTKIKTSGASSFHERKESNLKLAENSLNANQSPKIDNTQCFQPLLNVTSDNLSIVDEKHFVLSKPVESHDRNQNGNADSSSLSPSLIYQTVVTNASLDANEPQEMFRNRNETEKIQRMESKVKLADNSLNANRLPKIESVQCFQPLMRVASDNLSIIDENHFVPSKLKESHDRNQNGNAGSSLLSPSLIYQTVVTNASEPREIFPNHNVNETEKIQNTFRRTNDTKIKTSEASSFNKRKESNLKLAENSLNPNQLPKIDNVQYFQPLLNAASDNLSIIDENHFVPSKLTESNDRNKNSNADSSLISPPLIYQRIAIDASKPREIFPNHNVNETEKIQNTSRRIYDTNIKTSEASSFNKRKESNLKPADNSLNANQLLKIDNVQYFEPLLNVASDNLSKIHENHFVPSKLIESHDRNENGNSDSSLISPPLIYQRVPVDASEQRETFPIRNVNEMVQNTVPDVEAKTVEYKFANEKELQKASWFYLENNGLNYLNTTNFKRLNRREQKTKEQQLRVIHEMMNRGLDALHRNQNDDKPHDTNPYDFVSPHPSILERKSNTKKIAGNKVVFDFPKQKLGKSDETNKAMATTRRRIRNISLLYEDETAPKLKKSKNVDKVMTAPKSEVNRNKNRRTKASTSQTFTINNELADSTAVGKENGKSSLPNYRAKKPKIEILSVVDLGIPHRSSEIMNQRDNQHVFCNVASCNALFNNLNKFTLLTGACKQHEHQLVQFAKGVQSIYRQVDTVNTHSAAV